MNLSENLKEKGNRDHLEWFNQWFNQHNLEEDLSDASREGYIGIEIFISESKYSDTYKKRMRDNRTINELKKRLEGIFVEYKKEYHEYLGLPRMRDSIKIRFKN